MKAERHAPPPAPVPEAVVTLSMTESEAVALRRVLGSVDGFGGCAASMLDWGRLALARDAAYDALYALETQPARVHAQAKAARP